MAHLHQRIKQACIIDHGVHVGQLVIHDRQSFFRFFWAGSLVGFVVAEALQDLLDVVLVGRLELAVFPLSDFIDQNLSKLSNQIHGLVAQKHL